MRRIKDNKELQKARARLSTIKIDKQKSSESTKSIALNVMKLMRAGLCDEYVITAQGKYNVHMAEDVCRYITKWIKI